MLVASFACQFPVGEVLIPSAASVLKVYVIADHILCIELLLTDGDHLEDIPLLPQALHCLLAGCAGGLANVIVPLNATLLEFRPVHIL